MNAHSTNTVFQDDSGNSAIGRNFIATIDLSHHRVRINHSASAWMSELEKKFNEIVSLPVGWDGYLGQPVSFTTASFAAKIIERLYSENVPVPSIVPGADGSMQIEWHTNGFDVELDVLGPLKVTALRYDHITNRENELELESDFTQIVDWIQDLSSDREFQVRNLA